MGFARLTYLATIRNSWEIYMLAPKQTSLSIHCAAETKLSESSNKAQFKARKFTKRAKALFRGHSKIHTFTVDSPLQVLFGQFAENALKVGRRRFWPYLSPTCGGKTSLLALLVDSVRCQYGAIRNFQTVSVKLFGKSKQAPF